MCAQIDECDGKVTLKHFQAFLKRQRKHIQTVQRSARSSALLTFVSVIVFWYGIC